MKTIFASQTLILTAILAGSAAFSPLVYVAEKETAVNIPATAAAIWQSVDRETEALAKEIQTDKLDDLHQHALAIRDLVAALPAHSAALAPDKLEKVKLDIRFVAILAQRLDVAGDTNNKTSADTNLSKLEGILKSIRGYYPAYPANE